MVGPAHREWTVGPDGTRTLALEYWRAANDELHRVDGPAYNRRAFYWHNARVDCADLPWLRRGQGLLAVLVDPACPEPHGDGTTAFPTWILDARVTMTTTDATDAETAAPTATTYRSAVGGAVLLCV